MGKPYWMVLVCAWCSGGAAAEPTSEIPKLSWPTDLRARLASDFGERVRGGVKEFHGAIDLGVGHIAVAEDGSHRPVPVFAGEAGKVVYRVKNYGGRGQALVIEHAGRFTTVYGHIDPTVEVGERVTRGQQLGSITRWPGNEHLHFGVHDGPFDPKKPLASTRGIYPTGTDPEGVLDPLHHTDYPKELITDVSKQLADFFGGKPGDSSDEVAEIARREAQKIVPDVAKDVAKLFDPPRPVFLVTPPKGWRTVQVSEHRAFFSKLRREGSRNIVIDYVVPPSGDLDPEKFLREWLQLGLQDTTPLPLRGSQPVITGPRDLAIPGSSYQFSTVESRYARGGVMYVAVSNGRSLCSLIGEYFDDGERSVFLDVVRSFRFADAPASGQRDTEQEEEPDGPLALADAFAQARDFTRRWEGGYVNDPDDAGGATNFGITQRTYDRFRKEWGQTSRAVRDISAEEVSTIYQSYWESSGAGKLPPPLSAVHFDSSFHFNPRRAEAWKDDVVKAYPNDPVAAAKAYVEKRIAFRHERVKKEPSQKKFLKGWLNRDQALMELVTDGAK